MRLREIRESNGYTQAYIAEQLNIRQNTYCQYEKGQRQISIELLIRLARFYNVSTDYILELTDCEEPYPKY